MARKKYSGLCEVDILDKIARADLSNMRRERQGRHARPCWPSLKKFLMKMLWEASGIFVLVSALVQDLIKMFPCDQHL